jgi:UDP-N-acetylglucosamine 2-epimerase (hydrolysing)
VDYDQESIQKALAIVDNHQTEPSIHEFGEGNSAELFIKSLERSDIWQLNHQKQFRDI